MVVLGVALVGFHGHAKLRIPLARVLGANRGMGGEPTLTMVTVNNGTRPCTKCQFFVRDQDQAKFILWRLVGRA